MTSAFIDEFPHLLRNKKVLFTAIMCVIEFVLGIPCVFQGGIYVLQIMDWYCATFSLMLLSFTECVVIAWVYGVNRFYKDIELMIGFQPSAYWKVLWCFITPATILFIWSFSVSQLAPVSYGSYQYPTWAIIFGWMLGLCSLLPLPIVMVISILKEKGPFWQRVKKLARPADNFGPALPENREAYLASLEPCHHRPAAVLELPSPIYSPKKGGASGGAATCVLMPEERGLLSDSVTTVSDRSVVGQSTEFTSMLSDGQTLPVSKC